MNELIVNIHGRRPGRGIRPWLIVPKLLGVTLFLGGLAAAWTILLHSPPENRQDWQQLAQSLSRIFRFVVVPGILLTVLMGVLLYLQHPRIFLRLRWLQVKLALAVLGLPPLHLLGRTTMMRLQREIATGETEMLLTRLNHFRMLVALAITLAVVLLILGRIKPRLGQNWAKSYKRFQDDEAS